MAKQGMKRQHDPKPQAKNTLPQVPQIHGKAKTTKTPANPIIAGTLGADLKVYHQRPIPKAHGIIDNDLARDNLENNIPFADLQDL